MVTHNIILVVYSYMITQSDFFETGIIRNTKIIIIKRVKKIIFLIIIFSVIILSKYIALINIRTANDLIPSENSISLPQDLHLMFLFNIFLKGEMVFFLQYGHFI